MINAATTPTIYNLGGQTFLCKDGAGLCVRRNDLTLLNGTFVATQASPCGEGCLNIMGSGTQLDNINVEFVSRGVTVCNGGKLMMQDCILSGENVGITVSSCAGQTCLSAFNVWVRGCNFGIEVMHCAAQLFDCKFEDTELAIGVHGQSGITASDTSFDGCWHGLVVTNTATAEMVHCTWTDTVVSSVVVQDPRSLVRLLSCSLDKTAEPYEGGEVEIQKWTAATG